MPEQYDVIIIGAGVVGSLVARALSRYQLRLLLLEKHNDVAEGTTKANTAIVHAGYDAKPGSNKARLNVAGNRMYDNLCAELDAEFDESIVDSVVPDRERQVGFHAFAQVDDDGVGRGGNIPGRHGEIHVVGVGRGDRHALRRIKDFIKHDIPFCHIGFGSINVELL